jgi:hypothetical protein
MRKFKKYWVICPKQVEVPYINSYRMADSKKGCRFEIVADYDNENDAINKAEEIIGSGKYALIHNSVEHIDYYKRKNWGKDNLNDICRIF